MYNEGRHFFSLNKHQSSHEKVVPPQVFCRGDITEEKVLRELVRRHEFLCNDETIAERNVVRSVPNIARGLTARLTNKKMKDDSQDALFLRIGGAISAEQLSHLNVVALSAKRTGTGRRVAREAFGIWHMFVPEDGWIVASHLESSRERGEAMSSIFHSRRRMKS